MAITVYSEQETFELAIAYFQKAYKGAALGENSFLGDLARATAQLAGAIQAAQLAADKDAVPGTTVDLDGVVKARCSSAALDAWAFVYGLPTNRGPGKYGRNGAQAATGGAGPVLGVPGTIVPAGSLLIDPSGLVVLQLAAGVVIPGSGTIQGVFNATTPGAASNLPVGTKLTWQSPVMGLDPSVTLGTALKNGFDVEDDVALVLRLLRRLQNPPKGGTASDYREWAEAATDAGGALLGISRAYVYPHRSGIGSVDVVVTQDGSGASRDPGAAKAAAVQAYLDARRIATDTVYVVRPRFPAGERLSIVCKVVAREHYTWDWDDAAPGLVVSGTGTSLILSSSAPPASLRLAIDNATKPRIQLPIPAFSPLPVQRRVLSYAVDTPTAGQCTLTLEAALPAAAPGGALVYAGGGAVDPVAVAVLGYVNSIGPSNQSGYADPRDSWDTVTAVSRIAQSAIDAADVDGSKVVVYSPMVGVGVGVTIAVGADPPDAEDVPLYDNVPGQGPQMPEVVTILVVRG